MRQVCSWVSLELVLESHDVFKGLMDKARQAQASGQVKDALPKVLGHLSRLSTFLNHDEMGVVGAGACVAPFFFPMAAMLQMIDSHYTSSLSRSFSLMSGCSGAVRLASTCVWHLGLSSPRVGQLWQGHELHLVMYCAYYQYNIKRQ